MTGVAQYYSQWLIGVVFFLIDQVVREKLGPHYDLLSFALSSAALYYALDVGVWNILSLLGRSYLLPLLLFVHYKLAVVSLHAISQDTLSFVIGLALSLYLVFVPQMVNAVRLYFAGKQMKEEGGAALTNILSSLVSSLPMKKEKGKSRMKRKEEGNIDKIKELMEESDGPD